MLDLKPEQVDRIVAFLGYGNLAARVWFIGLEEGLGLADEEDAFHNLQSRATCFEETMDLYMAHKRLRENRRPIDIETKKTFTPVWVWMAKIMRASLGHCDWKDLNSAKAYVHHHLGRANGETFLTELSPVPQKSVADKRFRGKLLELQPKLEERVAIRKRRLQETLRTQQPKLVICYGAQQERFADLLQIQWEKSSVEKCFHAVRGRFLLLPFFGVGCISHEIVQQLSDHNLLRYHSE